MTTKREEERWIDELVGALHDPVIVYPSPWTADLPDWIMTQVHLERLIMNIKVNHEGGVPVGDTEVLAYMFSRTMDSPMPEQWNRIYTFVFNQAMNFKRVAVPEDLKSEKLTDYDMQALKHLKHWIYERRVKHRKGKARGERQQAKQETELETVSLQQSFL